ncbi:hypothetical protein [Rhizobium leguminosarum]
MADGNDDSTFGTLTQDLRRNRLGLELLKKFDAAVIDRNQRDRSLGILRCDVEYQKRRAWLRGILGRSGDRLGRPVLVAKPEVGRQRNLSGAVRLQSERQPAFLQIADECGGKTVGKIKLEPEKLAPEGIDADIGIAGRDDDLDDAPSAGIDADFHDDVVEGPLRFLCFPCDCFGQRRD